MAGQGPPTGQHLGKTIADLLLRKDVNAAGIIAQVQNAAKGEYHTAFMEEGETYFAEMMRPVWQHFLDNEALPDEMRGLMTELADPQAQFGFVAQILALVSFVITAFFQIGEPLVRTVLNVEWANQPEMPLSPDEAAVAVLKGWMDQGAGATEAAMSGTNASRFATMVDVNGNPPPLEMGMEAVRRGLMPLDRFVQLIRESRYRVEWADIFQDLIYGPPSPAVAVQAAVQGHLDGATAQSIVAQGGINPGNYQWLYDTAGRPPGVQEIIGLVRRGLATQADVATAVQESDIKNKYIPLIQQLVVHIPPMRSITQMIHKGVMDAATGARYLAMLGFEPQIVSNLVAEAQAQSTAAHKGETESLIVGSYKAGLIDAPTASAHLAALGYDASAIPMILALADHQIEAAFTTKAITRIGTLYTAGKIDRVTASGDLGAVGVAAGTVARYLATWDLERATVVKRLTAVQLGYGVKQGALTSDEMAAELVAEGYSSRDAAILTAHYG